MALSGTLETFSLPDVLRLLSSTKKTGCLALDGDRGRGCLWVEDGDVVAAEADRAVGADIDGVVFELLRFTDATFEFDSGSQPADPADPRTVEAVLAEGEHRLAEWHEIEAVVPSLDIWARMVPEVEAEVTVAPEQWRLLALIGAGVRGHDLADQLEQGEYDVCRQLRDLVETGMVGVDDVAPELHAPARLAEPAEPIQPIQPAEVAALGADLASFVAVGSVEGEVAVEEVAWGLEEAFAQPALDEPALDEPVLDEPVLDEPVLDEAVLDEAVPDDVPVEAPEADVEAPLEAEAEVETDVPDLSHLSPKAAAAVEATWASESSDSPAEESAEDDLDQNLLLRFLSSAKQ